jgi:hypothetical protein
MRDHTKLRAFELADEIAVLIYRVTAEFPREEMCIKKAHVSITKTWSMCVN